MRRTRNVLLAFSTLISLVGSTVACGSSDSADDTLTVFAASSLTESFERIAEAFESQTGIAVETSFASSSDLAAQISEGAPADVFASADTKNMTLLIDSGAVIGDARAFASNSLSIVVAPGNPLGIESVSDLADPDLVLVTCDESVPIGRYTAEMLASAGVRVAPDSFEENVKGIVSKVALGEADAGVVYVTDVLAAGDSVAGVAIPDEFDITVTYPIAATSESATARRFVEFVATSETARRILAEFGFGEPS